MNCFIIRYPLIKFIRIGYRTVFDTGSTTGALVFDNISGTGFQTYLKIPRLPFEPINFSECQNLYIWMPADLDQFR